jgi:hypothetical protein
VHARVRVWMRARARECVRVRVTSPRRIIRADVLLWSEA